MRKIRIEGHPEPGLKLTGKDVKCFEGDKFLPEVQAISLSGVISLDDEPVLVGKMVWFDFPAAHANPPDYMEFVEIEEDVEIESINLHL